MVSKVIEWPNRPPSTEIGLDKTRYNSNSAKKVGNHVLRFVEAALSFNFEGKITFENSN